MSKRDDFSAQTKRALSARVGYSCSNPDCNCLTIGPASNKERTINIGKAAHITAAASGGPRFDPKLSIEERRSISNGIWLCAMCADLIDRDIEYFTINLLVEWKKISEGRAFKAIATRTAQPCNLKTTLDEEDMSFLQMLALAPEDDIESITTRMRKAALDDTAKFRNARTWPSYVIPLNLTLLGRDEQTRITLEGMAKGTSTAKNICIISPPGTGKTDLTLL